MIAVLVVSVMGGLLCLIYIGSPTVFNDVISLTVTGFYCSYFLPSALLLWRRTTGQMAPYGSQITVTEVVDGDESVVRQRLVWGPWRVPGILGILNNAYACLYMIFAVFWSFWPAATPTTAKTMNYSVVVTCGVIIFSIVWYLIIGHKQYKGPGVDKELDNGGVRRTTIEGAPVDTKQQ